MAVLLGRPDYFLIAKKEIRSIKELKGMRPCSPAPETPPSYLPLSFCKQKRPASEIFFGWASDWSCRSPVSAFAMILFRKIPNKYLP